MKATSKNLFIEIVTNPISRNLVLILLGAFLTATALVTASVMLLVDHW